MGQGFLLVHDPVTHTVVAKALQMLAAPDGTRSATTPRGAEIPPAP
jgi:hypothetical protein